MIRQLYLRARPHEQFGYGYDAAWNLNSRTNNQLVQTFSVNDLNELTGASRSGTLTVAGASSVRAASVTVNSQAAQVYSDNTFAREGNSLADGINTFNVQATNAQGRTASASVSVNLPLNVNYLYDSRGNLTNDGLRTFDYDDENQLKRVTVAGAWKSEFEHDRLLRRRARREYTRSGGSWVQTNEVHYLYDRRLVVQERDASNVPQVTYTRGNDLSGELHAAGGIGGLLARSDRGLLAVGDPAGHAYYHADGNGNITCLVAQDGSVVAQYAYDPFGNILAMSGTLASANLYRFSSKEYHPNSGLVYYLYRYYDPNLQRWLNRDPIAERGGINLYTFTFNNPVRFVDVFGNDPACSAYTGFGMGMNAEQLTQLSKDAAPAAVVLGLYTAALIASDGGVLPVTGGVLGRILGWLGLGGAAAESPQGQQAIQRTPQLVNSLLQELRALEQALWEDRVAADNARNAIAKARNMGIEPNPYGLMNDLKSFEEGVAAKEKAIQAINDQLRNLGCQGH